ncbi:AMP-binding protein [Moraxella atlantae]|uniref:Long-chain-fatty-acid--CoA ligase n=1 Tax=Faucicola atlantae TaxID=34059 RepID=A0A378Q1C7_9GAMM|nr:AMP-binding protein [Moraxella atlantae]OPH33129.1 long-chain fatty acid--CoA ligase [Moraxella atlantae]STY94621.1 Long-chain-fatty-acid--CoA ligase [Moraxella atlantae]
MTDQPTTNDNADVTHSTAAPRLATRHEKPWLKTYRDHGMSADFTPPANDVTLMNVFENAFERFGNKQAYVCMGSGITFRQLDIYSRQVAAYLQGLGLKKGARVAVMMPNILQYPVCMMGILRAGYTLVNVNPLYTAHELEHQLQDADVEAMFILENFAHTYEEIGKPLVPHVVVCRMGDLMGTVKGFIVNAAVRYIKKMVPKWRIANAVSFKTVLDASATHYHRPDDLTGDDIAVLQYTGGTTGVAKGAMLTHHNLVSNTYQALAFVRQMFAEDDNEGYALIALPLYHIFSFTACALISMKQGLTGLLIPDPRDLDGFVKELDKYKPRFFPAINTLFNGLAHHEGFRKMNHDYIELSLSGGMSVMSSTAAEWKKITGTDIVEGYGLSETSPIATLNMLDTGFTGKIGVPFPGTDIKLIDDDGNEVALGERGEIAIKGPQVMKGYWKRPEATRESMTDDGFFKSGDIGIMDEQGLIKIVDRKKDMILVSGFNVYPNEVEDVLASHPKVLEVGVIGVPSDKSGEIPKAYIVRKDPSLTEKEILDYARKELTGYKRPRAVQFVDELPKSNVGKILRKEIRKMEEAQRAKNES